MKWSKIAISSSFYISFSHLPMPRNLCHSIFLQKYITFVIPLGFQLFTVTLSHFYCHTSVTPAHSFTLMDINIRIIGYSTYYNHPKTESSSFIS